MKKVFDLKVETVGKPDLQALSQAEQKIFFEALLNRLKEICNATDKTDTKPESD